MRHEYIYIFQTPKKTKYVSSKPKLKRHALKEMKSRRATKPSEINTKLKEKIRGLDFPQGAESNHLINHQGTTYTFKKRRLH